MRRGNPNRDKLIIEEIKKGGYQKDIAELFGLTPARVCQIKKRLIKKVASPDWKNRAKIKTNKPNL